MRQDGLPDIPISLHRYVVLIFKTGSNRPCQGRPERTEKQPGNRPRVLRAGNRPDLPFHLSEQVALMAAEENAYYSQVVVEEEKPTVRK